MATARELIEQADALMRKNRSRNDADIPVLTDRVDDPWPVVAEDEVPLLLDEVETAADDEVGIVPARERGEASLWPGPDTVDPATHSVTGSSPDTQGMVAPVLVPAVGSQPTPLPRGSEPAAATPILLAQGEIPSADNESFLAPSAAPALTAPAADELASEVEGSRAREPFAPIPGDDEVQIELMSLPADAEGSASVRPDVAEEDAVFLQTIAAAKDHVSEESSTAGLGAAEDHAQQIERRRRADDAERWDALAEQISMQVLQRIDLFTDTGLKVQLAEHLRPIVERAGYELVAAINEHVGRLLRTYVAEAIEREIAQWRDENR